MNTDSQLAVSSAVLLRTAGLSFLVTISLRSLQIQSSKPHQTHFKDRSVASKWLRAGKSGQEKQEVHTQLQHSQLRLIF